MTLGTFVLPRVYSEEPDDSAILQRILGTRAAIIEATGGTNLSGPAVFIAAWDFDGTILKGDCSEGLRDGDRTIYRGLAQVAIESGLSSVYPPEGGFARFWTDYTNMDARVGHWLAYPFIPQMLRGARAEDVLRLSQTYFSSTLSNYLMASSAQDHPRARTRRSSIAYPLGQCRSLREGSCRKPGVACQPHAWDSGAHP